MRGLNREEKEEVMRLLMEGNKPSDVARKFDLPLSTVTTWNKVVRKEKKNTGIPLSDPKDERRERLKLFAKILNDSEAAITTAASEIVKDNVPDYKWMEFQGVVSTELKNLVMLSGN